MRSTFDLENIKFDFILFYDDDFQLMLLFLFSVPLCACFMFLLLQSRFYSSEPKAIQEIQSYKLLKNV